MSLLDLIKRFARWVDVEHGKHLQEAETLDPDVVGEERTVQVIGDNVWLNQDGRHSVILPPKGDA